MLNLETLKDVVGNDPVMMQDMLAQFLETTQADLHNLQDAVAADNARDVGALAHRIKGSCYVIGATTLADAANALEAAGRQDSTAEFQGLAERVVQEFAKVQYAIQEL